MHSASYTNLAISGSENRRRINLPYSCISSESQGTADDMTSHISEDASPLL